MGRLLLCLMVAQASLAAAGTNWSALDPYQRRISRTEFETLVSHVYCPSGALTDYLVYDTNSVSVYSTSAKIDSPLFVLQFAPRSSPVLQYH